MPDGGRTAASDSGQAPAPDGGRAGGRSRFGRHRLAQSQERAEAEALPGVQDRAGRLGEIGPWPARRLWLLPALLGQSWHPVTRAPIHPSTTATAHTTGTTAATHTAGTTAAARTTGTTALAHPTGDEDEDK